MKITGKTVPPRAVHDWSIHQQAVFREVGLESKRPLVVRARAGSGKTTVLLESLYHLPRQGELSILLCAYNLAIAEELSRRAPLFVKVSTLHSFGLQVMKENWGGSSLQIAKGPERVRRLLKQVLTERERDPKTTKPKSFPNLVDLIKACKNRMVLTEAGIAALGKKFEVPEEEAEIVLAVLRRSCVREKTPTIDFDDMVFLPAILPQLHVPVYDVVFVDETQDMNAAQLALARKASKEGRLILIGDDRQGLYEFNGADVDFMDRVITDGAKELLLPVTFRCPQKVVRLARQVVPDLEALPSAPHGKTRVVPLRQAWTIWGEKDVVLSRYNAPIVKLALEALRAGRRVSIRSGDFSKEISKFVQNTKSSNLEGLRKSTRGLLKENHRKMNRIRNPGDSLTAEEAEVLEEVGKEESLAALERSVDQCDVLLELMKHPSVRTPGDLLDLVETLFSVKKNEGVLLFSTVHQAKGLEWNRVFLLSDTFRPEKSREEENIWYVALTRSKSDLFFVMPESGEYPSSDIVRYAMNAISEDEGTYGRPRS